ncbi:thioredoxin domain-containing protein [Flavobacterium sp. TP390]|uniref:Thioredoxin domain-containing protein n=1 Tax=Flavobacterium profundi TaxID=1774945 RepID=A0A6I4IH24_9FLAO|nr:vitamin K epoxide reductase family protein [Flavobacterium profundi]MVO08983.1 thioredoxin domain-containing protein [Flavobacterium profundi]
MNLFYNKLKISKEEFLFQFQSHPNYPSLLSFSDTLSFLGIKNDVYEIDKDNWGELPNQFITIHNNKFTYVEKKDNDYLIYSDKASKMSKSKLHDEASDFVIIFEKVEEVLHKSEINFKWLIYSFFALFSLYSYFQNTVQLFLFNILSIIGIFISLGIFNKKFGKESVVINALCDGSKKKSESISDCEKIFNSDKINFYRLRLSDFSLIYFLGIFVLGLFIPLSESILKVISYFSILVIAYSLFYQLFIEKTFCRICLTIILILIVQILISYLFFNNTFYYNVFFKSIIVFLILFGLIIYINNILSEKEDFYRLSLKSIKFKKNYDIFKKELLVKHFDFHNKNEVFWIGKRDAKLNISIVTNPFCGYCKEAHIILEKIINKYTNISAQIRFNYYPELANDDLTSIISAFKNIYDSEGEKSLLKAIEIWYKNNNLKNFKKEYENFFVQADLSKIILLANDNRNNGLTFTPVFLINNYQFPDKYEREDIFYFIDDLIEDEEFFIN